MCLTSICRMGKWMNELAVATCSHIINQCLPLGQVGSVHLFVHPASVYYQNRTLFYTSCQHSVTIYVNYDNHPLCGQRPCLGNPGILSRPCTAPHTDLGVHQMLCDLKCMSWRLWSLDVRGRAGTPHAVRMSSSIILRHFPRNWCSLCHPEDFPQGRLVPQSKVVMTQRTVPR